MLDHQLHMYCLSKPWPPGERRNANRICVCGSYRSKLRRPLARRPRPQAAQPALGGVARTLVRRAVGLQGWLRWWSRAPIQTLRVCTTYRVI